MRRTKQIKESKGNNLGIAAFFLALGAILIVLLPFASAARIIGFDQIQFGEGLSINATALNIFTKNTSRIYVTNAGLVGIGTLSPESKLHINVSDTANKSVTTLITLDHVLATSNESTGGIGIGILFRAVNNDSEIVNVSFINATLVNAINGSEASALSFYTRSGQGALVPRIVLNGTDVFIAPTTGKVGIGTKTPSHTLTVVGSLNVTGVSYLGDVAISADNITTNEVVSRDGNITFFNDTRDELLRITSVGSIGIGTKLPDTKLKVAGDINITGTIWSQGTNVTDEHGWKDIGSVVHTITSDDSVGIGTTSPSEKLQVAGNGSFDGDLVVRGNLLSTGGDGSGAAIIGWVDDGTTVRLNTATDLVGIGTSNPESKLHISVSDNSNTSVTNLLTLDHNLSNPENSTGGIGVGILFRAVNNDSEMVNVSFINASLVNAINGSEASALSFYTRTGGGVLTSILSINGSNITFSQLKNCNTIDTDANGVLTCGSDSGGSGEFSKFQYSNITEFFGVGNESIIKAENTSFVTAAAGWTDDGNDVRLTTASDSVGIGKTSPNFKLDVAGQINASAVNVTGTVQATTFIGDGSSLTGITTSTSVWNSSGTNVFLNDTTASVGIGTSIPAARLDVNGTGPGNLFRVGNDTTDFLTINGTNGYVTIGTRTNVTNGSYRLDVIGSVRATDAHVFSDGTTQAQAATPNGFSWGVTTASFRHSFDTSGQETAPTGLFFKPDGTRMYVTGSGSTDVNEYNLTPPWDVSTASFLQAFDVSGEETAPHALAFKPDGTKMYVMGTVQDKVTEYDLSTPWNVSTAVFNQNFSVANEESTPEAVTFKPDGTKMYVMGTTGQDVNEYHLTTPWDVSTASFFQLFDVSGEETSSRGLAFKPDGTKMYVTGETGDDINQYDLSTPWDVGTASFVSPTFDVSGEGGEPNAVAFSPDGTKMYVSDNAGQKVNEYDLGLIIPGKLGIGNITNPTMELHVIGNANISNTIFVGGNLTFGNTSDYAEMFESDVELENADVVCLDEYKKIDKCTARADPSVIGVVSTNPSIIGRTGFEKAYPVGLLGVVPTKVIGPVDRFSMLTTSYRKGYAEQATRDDFGAIIGKAMEECYEDECRIDVVVNLQ